MGRQIPVFMDQADEESFLHFLRSIGDISVIESFAPRAEDLWVNGFSESFAGHWRYFIWNREFPWEPLYGEVGVRSVDPDCIGWKFLSNTRSGPVLEFRRSNFQTDEPGRLYWGRVFSAPDPLEYDEEAFSRWIDRIWGWVRRRAQKTPNGTFSPYVFPGASKALGLGYDHNE